MGSNLKTKNRMKKVLLASCLLFSASASAQVANRLLPIQVPSIDTLPVSLMFVDTVAGSMNRMYMTSTRYIFRRIKDSSGIWNDQRYLQLTDTPTLAAVARSGSYTDISGTPDALSDFTNDMGFITGISSSDVTAALGFTPYSSSNPSNYITSSSLAPYLLIDDTSGKWKGAAYTPSNSEVISALGYTPYSNSNPSGFITSASLSNYLLKSDTTGKFYPANGNPNGYLTSSSLDDYLLKTDTSGKFYPLNGNPSNFLTNAGLTDYLLKSDTTGKFYPRNGNPSSFINQSGARTSISLTTTGTGTPTYNNATGVINIPQNTHIVNNNPGRLLVSNASAANGFQVSATRDADVRYSVTINTTVSLSGNASGYAIIETCPTNSSTSSDWTEVARVTSGQSGSLVIGLVLNQSGGGQISAFVPSGYYARIRTVSTSGTPTFTLNSQQEVLR